MQAKLSCTIVWSSDSPSDRYNIVFFIAHFRHQKQDEQEYEAESGVCDGNCKTVNNNVVISQNPVSGEELVLIGRGIGFQKKTGDEIDESKIQKQFHPAHHKNSDQYMALLEKIPFEYMRVADDIIAYAKCSLGKPLDEKIQVSLTDHLAFAIDRAKQGIVFKNALLWEIKRFYNHEFLIGKEAVAMVRQRLEVELSEDEAGFFALHIVNAELDMDMGKSIQMTGMIEDIIKNIRDS